MPARTPEDRSRIAKLAANTRWSRSSQAARAVNAARGQAGLRARFEREVDPNGELDPAERSRRATAAHKAHMARLALASSKARAARKSDAA